MEVGRRKTVQDIIKSIREERIVPVDEDAVYPQVDHQPYPRTEHTVQ
ncbi:MAG: hypothetical protein AB1510_04260 [Bacillota bacterium]